MIDKVASALERADALEARANKRVAKAKTPETLDEAYARIIEKTKLDEAERRVVDHVFSLWRDGRMSAPAKVTKKAIFEASETWKAMERERKKRLVVEGRKESCWIVTRHDQLAALDVLLMYEDIVSLDTETTGLDLYNDRVVGIAGYFPVAGIEFYVPFGHTTDQTQLGRSKVLAFYEKCVKGRKSIWHNYKYDAHMSLNEGIVPDAPYWDTMTGMKILNNNEDSYSLKALYTKYIDKTAETITYDDLFDNATIYDKDIVLSGIYAAGDAYKTYKLYEFEKRHIDTVDNLRTVWYEIEQPLLHIDALTERNGICVDLAHIESLKDELRPKYAEAERKVREAYSLEDTFNFDSNHDLAWLIYDRLGVDPDFPKRFKKNARSTAAEVLDALCDDLPALEPLLEYRTLGKLLGTYIEKIPLAIEPATGRMHFTLDSLGTDTGRYSSYEYTSAKNSKTGDTKKGFNVQNVPARTADGVRVRQAFIPRPGNVFVMGDLSQIEPRTLAHVLYTLFNDDSLKRIYDQGDDIYVQKAMEVFELPLEFCVDGAKDPTGSFKPRKAMKDGVLAYCYGQSPPAFARKQNLPIEKATTFFTSMQTAIPSLSKFRAWVYDTLAKRGNVAYSETLWGRKRRYPDYRNDLAKFAVFERDQRERGEWFYRQGRITGRTDEETTEIEERSLRLRHGKLTAEDHEEFVRIGLNFRKKDERDRVKTEFYELRGPVANVRRQAVNHVIQGTAADILKQNIIRLYGECEKRGWTYVTSIHDEVMCELPIVDVTPDNLAVIEDAMTRTVELSVPLKTDIVVSPRWMVEFSPDEWFAKGAM